MKTTVTFTALALATSALAQSLSGLPSCAVRQQTLAFAQQFCGSAGVTITLPTAAAGTDTATSSLAAYTSTTTAPGSSSSVAVTSVTTIPAGYNPAIAGNNGTGISTVPSNSTASMAVTSTMATPSVTTTTSSTPEAFTGAAVLVTAGQWVVGGVAALERRGDEDLLLRYEKRFLASYKPAQVTIPDLFKQELLCSHTSIPSHHLPSPFPIPIPSPPNPPPQLPHLPPKPPILPLQPLPLLLQPLNPLNQPLHLLLRRPTQLLNNLKHPPQAQHNDQTRHLLQNTSQQNIDDETRENDQRVEDVEFAPEVTEPERPDAGQQLQHEQAAED
ncbi:hypothetical protein M8818_003521 [Zalaria obscura]|uniref:Uncharacterized protein n=1 Tax=Zalaria obscura TaxID=2024903 RepID=A0ACC3SHH0_9PEZI